MLQLSSPVTEIPRIGPAKAKYLQKLSITHARDFLYNFPRRYDDFSTITPIIDLKAGSTMTVRGKVAKVDTKHGFYGRRRMLRIFVDIEDDTGVLPVTWYNLHFLPKQLWIGREIFVAGKVELNPNSQRNAGRQLSADQESKKPHATRYVLPASRFRMRSPVLEFAPSQNSDEKLTHTGRITPVYPETYGVTSRFLRYQVKNILPLINTIPEYLPPEIIKRHQLMAIHQAIKAAHFPDSTEQLKQAEERLHFDELFFLQLAALHRRQARQQYNATKIKISKKSVASITAKLPFKLTNAQVNAIDDIVTELKRNVPMNRLVQGDVGSGKSAVALVATTVTLGAGYKVMYLAPTEILARQQYADFTKTLGPKSCALLIGHTKKHQREEIKDRLISQQPLCLIGTHAILQDDILLTHLGLVIVDEQHRFGVKQRQALLRRSTQMNTQIEAETDQRKLIYQELTYKIRGACFTVMQELGPGLKENVYHRSLEQALLDLDIAYTREQNVDVKFKGKKVGSFRPDLIIEGKIIVELKALPFIGKTEDRQIWTYLKGSDYKLGLVINFGAQNLEIKRVVYDTARNKKNSLRPSASNPRKSALQVRQYAPHLLSMTATPIPRTLSLTVYGDLDVSVLDEMPPGRQPIVTNVVASAGREAALLEVLERIHQGQQAYVIAPLVDESDTLQVKSATETVIEMKKYFPGVAIELMHGKMSPEEKKSIMGNFSAGAIQILVATSVVEVGVNVPNATSMIIEGAERFGLSQLHQMRGRVGRGEHKSFCYLFPTSDEGLRNPRLQALKATTDGFKIAEEDLLLRGPGEIYGTDQSGYGNLQVASLLDYPLIKKTRTEAKRLLDKDPELKKYPILRKKVEQKNTVTHFE